MSSLKLAGIIGGLGTGLGRGLEQMQTGIIQQGLAQDRYQHDDAAATVERTFQMQKLKQQMEHETQLHQEKMGSDIVLHTGDRVAAAEQTDKKIASEERISGAKLTSEEGIKREDRAVDREKIAAMRQHYAALGKRLSAKAAQLDPTTKAQLDLLKNKADKYLDLAKTYEKPDLLGDATEQAANRAKADDLLAEVDTLYSQAEQLVGLNVPRQSKPKGGAPKDDPFAAVDPLKGR